jgi:hypothetical protein
MAEKIVHIGFPKTGTTYLQRSVFPAMKGIRYVDYETCARLFHKMTISDPLDYDLEEIKKQVNGLSESSTTLFSLEALCVSPFVAKAAHRSQVAQNLKALGFDKILVVVRDQLTMLDSLYREYVHQGGTLRFKSFLDLEGKRNWANRQFNVDYLKYHLIIEKYIELFGRERVLVLSYEDLKDNRTAFVQKIVDFIGAEGLGSESSSKENPSLSLFSLEFLRWSNFFLYSNIKPSQFFWNGFSTKRMRWLLYYLIDFSVGGFFGKKNIIKLKGLEPKIKNYYQQSNKQLEALTGIQY